MTIVVKPIQNVTVVKNAANSSINLFRQFDDPFTTGLVAEFKLYDTSLGGGVSRVVLFDQPGKGAPLTVRNFRNYVNDGAYRNTIIHRSVPNFVVQGGGFIGDGVEEAIADDNPARAISPVRTDDPVRNEFSRGRSNVQGTIAMAKLGTDPNSATSQWFFNLADNSANLDEQNGGFTVFGKVLSEKDFNPVEAIGRLPIRNASGVFNQSALNEMPFIDPPQSAGNLQDRNLVRYRNITVSREDELTFRVSRNTNPGLVDARVNGDGRLILDYGRNRTGTSRITVQATNLLGDKVKDTFRVRVDDSRTTTVDRLLRGGTLATDDVLVGTVDNDTLKGRGGDDVLEGGLGNDTITTGSGRDIVRIRLQEGVDLVTDFRVGRDRIEFTDSLSFDDLSIAQRGEQAVIRVDQTPLLRLENVDAAALTQADIV